MIFSIIRIVKGIMGKAGYSEIDGETTASSPQLSRRWKVVGIISVALLVGFVTGTVTSRSMNWNFKKTKTLTCLFCDQSPPELHHDRSYTIELPNTNTNNSNDEPTLARVTPMTISYDYELYDGENIFTFPKKELIPNLEFDYAILALGSARNINRDTGADVSLDEVYLHHVTLAPINMIGAEVLSSDDETDPYMRLPEGYALHVLAAERPHLGINAHLLSNKNLAPIEGSVERAHKECNECYYAPGKGSHCTPEVSGTFYCCGDSLACTVGGEDCACTTTTTTTSSNRNRNRSKTKYRIELDFLVSRDIHKFQRVDQWNFAAPHCSINLKGDAVLEDYAPDNFCAKNNGTTTYIKSLASTLFDGGGSLFHQVPENNEEPYLRTTVNVLAPSGGQLVWAQSHLHTGGVNATLYQNGKILCSTDAVYGTNPDASSNARDEQNHLVRISSCYDQIQNGIRFEAGDVFTTESYYYGGVDDARFKGDKAAGEHKNVMTMFFTGVVLDGNSKYLTEERTSFNLWNDFVHVAGLYP